MESIRRIESEILELDDARYRATVAGDCEALDTLLAPQLAYTHSLGYTESKDDYLTALRSGRVRYLKVDRHLGGLHMYEGCAVMHGSVDVAAEVAGRAVHVASLFMSTWVRGDAGWQMASWAATPLPRPQPAGTPS